MRVWETGEGPPLLAVHGLGGGGRYWRGLADALGGRYHVVAPDLAGFGSSDKPKDAAYDRPFHLADLDAALAACVPDHDEPVAVVGHSLGAMLALLWSAQHVERVRALGLVATPYPVPGERWDPDAWRGPRATVLRGVAKAFRFAWPLLSLPVLLSGRYPGPVVRDFGRQTFRARTRSLYSLWSDPTLLDELPVIERLPPTLPVLLVHAVDDSRVPARNVGRWRRHVPHAEPLLLPEGGHQILLRTDFEPLAAWLRRVGDLPSPGGPTLGR